MLKIILIAVGIPVIAVIILLLVAAAQPSEFTVSRSTTVDAPPDVVFAQVNDFHKWEAWNPWGKLDPDMKSTFEGAPSGEGAVYSWVGDRNVGAGRMTINESVPNDHIQIHLEFFKPMAGTSTAIFTFEPAGEGTQVTWTMEGTNNFVAKVMCLFVNMEKMMGDNFEKGLAEMRAAAEATAKT